MSEIIWTQGDRPTLYMQLTKKENGKVYDVSASTCIVTAKFRERGNTTESLWEATCTKNKPAFGMVWFTVPADGLLAADVPAGRYEIELTVTSSGLPETVIDIIKVRVMAEFPAVA